jgi:hypothetical protein
MKRIHPAIIAYTLLIGFLMFGTYMTGRANDRKVARTAIKAAHGLEGRIILCREAVEDGQQVPDRKTLSHLPILFPR